MVNSQSSAANAEKNRAIGWHEAVNKVGYDEHYAAFSEHFDHYTKLYHEKSKNARYFTKLGLYILLFSAVLYYLNGGSIKIAKPPVDKVLIQSILIFIPVLLVGFSLFVDLDHWQARFSKTHSKIYRFKSLLLLLISIVPFYIPLVLVCLDYPWQNTIGLLSGLGMGMLIVFYLVNWLEGHTRAWSRYRTTLCKLRLNHAEVVAERLCKKEAQRQLLLIVNNEIDDRHRDIVTDFHFFGDRITSLLRKK